MNEQKIEQHGRDIASFIAEMNAIKAEEERGERKTAHLSGQGFRAEDLEDEDREMWQKLKDKTMTPEEFATYRDHVESSRGPKDEISQKLHSRFIFVAFLANKATALFYGDL